jgi:hypothetical protein
MHVLRQIERSFRAVVPRAVRHAVRDRCRRLARGIRRERPFWARRESSAAARGRDRESHRAPPPLALVVLLADAVERSRLAARLDGLWCRVADPHDYEPAPGDYVHFPETGERGLSVPELRLVSLSLAHEPNDFVVVSRSIEPLPAVAVRSLRDACVIRADRQGCMLDPAGRWPRMRGRVLRLLTNRSPADAETSMERLLGTRCRTQGPHVFLAGRGKSPPRLFPGMKTSGFRGCCAPGTSSLTCGRPFLHSLLAGPFGRRPAARMLDRLRVELPALGATPWRRAALSGNAYLRAA